MCFILQEAILGYIEHFLGYVPQFLGNSLMFSHEILCISSSLHSDGHYEKKYLGVVPLVGYFGYVSLFRMVQYFSHVIFHGYSITLADSE